MADRLKGKIAIISGGATGMGGASSLLFAAEGATVGVIDRNEEAGRAVVDQIKNAGGKAVFAPPTSPTRPKSTPPLQR